MTSEHTSHPDSLKRHRIDALQYPDGTFHLTLQLQRNQHSRLAATLLQTAITLRLKAEP